MAEENENGQEKTEEPTQERRDEFRERGQVAVSKELTSVLVLASATIVLTFMMMQLTTDTLALLRASFYRVGEHEDGILAVKAYIFDQWQLFLWLIMPTCFATMVAAVAGTVLQTRFSWSWKRLAPDFKRLNPGPGLARMVGSQALMELAKGIGKMAAVILVSYLILRGEWIRVPALLNLTITNAWAYWGSITQQLFWAVGGLLVLVALADFIFNYQQLQKKMRMSKQEVKEDFKRREGDPFIRARIRRLQRDIATRQMLDATRDATVVVTNPTHFAVALKYELGMPAPQVVAKGVDFLALQMKEVAREVDIVIVEDKPLARTLYKLLEVGDYIPESLYKAVSEIIRHVFRIKGKSVRRG